MGRMRQLDGLRAIALLCVLVSHYSPDTAFHQADGQQPVAAAVAVLSAITIGIAHASWRVVEGPINRFRLRPQAEPFPGAAGLAAST
jgi:peptidoglycan/LPS O-acetylase OafA/YrhL